MTSLSSRIESGTGDQREKPHRVAVIVGFNSSAIPALARALAAASLKAKEQ